MNVNRMKLLYNQLKYNDDWSIIKINDIALFLFTYAWAI